MARKIKAVYKINKVLLNKVERLAKNGLNIKQIAISIGWHRSTLFDKISKNKDVADAIKRGQTKNIKELVSAMSKNAKGYKVVETHREVKIINKKESTMVKRIEKHFAPNATAGIFLLTNLDSENFQHKIEQTHKGDIIIKTDKDDDKL